MSEKKATKAVDNKFAAFIKENLGIMVALAVMCIFLAVFPATSSSFLTPKNMFNILRQISTNMLLACGMTMVIILGGIDLSVGSIIALSGVLSAGCVARYGLPIPAALLVACFGRSFNRMYQWWYHCSYNNPAVYCYTGYHECGKGTCKSIYRRFSCTCCYKRMAVFRCRVHRPGTCSGYYYDRGCRYFSIDHEQHKNGTSYLRSRRKCTGSCIFRY